MVTIIKDLEKEFNGTGEVSDFKYCQLHCSDHAFLYEVISDGKVVCYEVFERKITPICIDFDNRVYSETEFKTIYPKSKDFGIWAWSFMKYDSAYNKFKFISDDFHF